MFARAEVVAFPQLGLGELGVHLGERQLARSAAQRPVPPGFAGLGANGLDVRRDLRAGAPRCQSEEHHAEPAEGPAQGSPRRLSWRSSRSGAPAGGPPAGAVPGWRARAVARLAKSSDRRPRSMATRYSA